MDNSTLTSLIGSGVVGILVAIVTIIMKRAFHSTDEKINIIKEDIISINKSIEDFEKRLRDQEIKMACVQTSTSTLDEIRNKANALDSLRAEFLEKFVKSADFVREVQILANQLESVHRKIDHVDVKFDSLSTARGKSND